MSITSTLRADGGVGGLKAVLRRPRCICSDSAVLCRVGGGDGDDRRLCESLRERGDGDGGDSGLCEPVRGRGGGRGAGGKSLVLCRGGSCGNGNAGAVPGASPANLDFNYSETPVNQISTNLGYDLAKDGGEYNQNNEYSGEIEKGYNINPNYFAMRRHFTSSCMLFPVGEFRKSLARVISGTPGSRSTMRGI